MAPRRVQVNKLDYKKLSANDVICPICRSILIKPVTLPCSHGFCASCFETTTQNANLVCPVCRVRIGSWLRTATKSKKLINETFWQAIQASFPLQIRNKLNGLDAKSVAEKKANEKRDEANKKKEDKFSERLTVPSTSTRNPAKKAVLLNNFASKEYTCRILCQNTKESQKRTPSESLTIIQRKNKRVQKITESESNDRSNSIESECLYFKPIDYRHNPPSEGLAPIKVPTRKPNVNANAKILAPCGQNQINMNSLESAFARLFCPAISDEERNKNETNQQESTSKRKLEKTESKSRKKIKKPNEFEKKSEELPKLCDNRGVENINFSLSSDSNNVKKSTGLKHLSKKLFTEEDVKRSLQEKADFELATKLQQTFNQTSKYSTRSAVLKRMAATKQINIEGIMTPFEVN